MMSSTITNTNTTVTNSSNTTTSSTGQSSLSSTDFMTLLLAELQYQDPTSPTDTSTILTQTSELSSLQASNATQTAMASMASAFQTVSNYTLTSAIGKMADTGLSALNISNGAGGKFDVYLPSDTTSSVVTVSDSTGKTIKTFSYGAKSAGTFSVDWSDATDNSGTKVADGTYNVSVQYTDTSGNTAKTGIGAYPIESIKFVSGEEAQVKVGSSYIPISDIQEIYSN